MKVEITTDNQFVPTITFEVGKQYRWAGWLFRIVGIRLIEDKGVSE